MYYYTHNINDFLSSTTALSNSEMFTYLRLLWLNYERQQPFDGDVERLCLRHRLEADDVTKVLKIYFQQDENGFYYNARVMAEVGKVMKTQANKAQKCSDAGKIGARARWDKAVLEAEFEKFWKAYPKKQNKVRALKAWIKHRPDLKVCLEALKHHVKSDQWQKNDGTFIPHASTWINGNQWEDEVASSINNDYLKGVK